MKKAVVALCAAILLVGCAKQAGQNQYGFADVGQSTLVEFGTVLDAREVGITGRNSGLGATVGAAAGAGGGAYVGNGSGTAWAVAGGAIAGAMVGAAAEQAMADSKGVEYTVITESGRTMTIVQNMNKEDRMLRNGERVMVQISGSYQRVLPANHLPEKVKRPKGIKVED